VEFERCYTSHKNTFYYTSFYSVPHLSTMGWPPCRYIILYCNNNPYELGDVNHFNHNISSKYTPCERWFIVMMSGAWAFYSMDKTAFLHYAAGIWSKKIHSFGITPPKNRKINNKFLYMNILMHTVCVYEIESKLCTFFFIIKGHFQHRRLCNACIKKENVTKLYNI
jgi:hypothetical protein